MLWAFTVLDILTPEVMQLLAGALLALPREAFTQEAYIQLYQAKMSLSQQVGPRSGCLARAVCVSWLMQQPRGRSGTSAARGVLRRGAARPRSSWSSMAHPMTQDTAGPSPLHCFELCLPPLPACRPPSLQVHSVAQHIPPELLQQAETEWRQQSSVIKVSLTHRRAGYSHS